MPKRTDRSYYDGVSDNNGNILDSAYSSRNSLYIRRGHATSSQPGQMWRRAANLDINTHLSGHGLITWPGEADNLRQVKHVNSFFFGPVCHAAAATSVPGKIIKKKVYADQWMEQKLIQNLLSVIKGNHSITRARFVIAAPTLFLSPCHAVLIVRTCKHLSLITPLLLLSPALSLAGCLYLSSHPPWCFFPLPTINVAFKMPIDLFP